MKWTFIIVTAGIVAALCFPSCGGKKEEPAAAVTVDTTLQTIVGLASIEPFSRIVDLNCESSGVIQHIYKTIGDTLTAGELVLVINYEQESAQMQQAQSKLSTQSYTIEQLKANLQQAENSFALAKKNFSRDKALFEQQALTKVEYDQSESNFINAQRAQDAAQASLDAAKSRLMEMKTDIGYYQTILNKKELRAPTNGVLLSMDVRIGQNLSGTTSVGQFAPSGPLVAITEVDELFADRVKTGMKAIVRPQGSTEVLGTGTIVLTAPYLRKKSLFSDSASNLEDRRVREVRIQLDEGSKVLIGSRVECVIQLNN